MANIRSFKELKVWQNAMDAAMRVFELTKKFPNAEGEAAESQTWTELALRCGYLSDSEASELDGCYEHILAQLVRMIDHPDDWTVGANRPPRVPTSPGPRVNSRSPRHRVNSRTASKMS